ncbi:MAG: 1-(5-phosphoribosyl)-5-[(5-phosphoribosylamino)methylideneamino]imidazole-4-carboxamide isomerase [Deltaproteobacteria bacterium RBG_19FT_COMBO_58_16]|nr:MAG: 1-(5-phosphoribosyl)-5-[(5-phosphoribosylamino)methylideneamino]imidazole-4-carboxamide isomerase [Deltaproteobacteria bacterium RBG_19FT_COMBO_58_16]
MIIFPAIDIKDKKCVRLSQGKMDRETVYYDDPADVAVKWAEGGAEVIHLVDLNGAVEGGAINFEVIKRIVSSVDVPVQIGGGIRDEQTAEKYLGLDGVKRIIIGTAAHDNPALVESLTRKHPGRIAVGIDAKDGFVAIKGWVTVTDKKASELAKSLEGQGVACIIYTDISRDGMLMGPNIAATRELAGSINIPVIASGGITTIKDIEAYGSVPLEGIIIGKALYAGRFELADAIKAARGS